MYGVMIVEDEMLVRTGLRNSINWNELGLELLADACNGEEAFKLFKKQMPDLIITDIRMPKMDGMELIKRIREVDQRIRIIILTCLDDFKIAQDAIKHQVDGYIIKLGMTSREMENVIRKSIKILKEYGPPQKHVFKNEQKKYDSINKLFKGYLVYGKYNTREFKAGLKEARMNLCGKKVSSALLKIDHFDIFKTKYSNMESVNNSVFNIINKIATRHRNCHTVKLENSAYYIVIGFQMDSEEHDIHKASRKIIMDIKGALERYFELTVSAGISRIKDSILSIDSMYNESLKALKFNFYAGLGTISEYNSEMYNGIVNEKTCSLLEPLPELEGLGCKKEYVERIKGFSFGKYPDIKEMGNFFVHLMNMTALKSTVYKDVFEDLLIDYTNRIKSSETFDEMYSGYREFVMNAVAAGKERYAVNDKISEAVSYIKKHYNSEIPLNHVAKLINLSPNYFSSLFKKVMDINYSDYVINYRIEKAKELLLETGLLSYEISEKVGFLDKGYFSRTFKKITGYSPNEYRKRWCGK